MVYFAYQKLQLLAFWCISWLFGIHILWVIWHIVRITILIYLVRSYLAFSPVLLDYICHEKSGNQDYITHVMY
jgi:hypothetical protein